MERIHLFGTMTSPSLRVSPSMRQDRCHPWCHSAHLPMYQQQQQQGTGCKFMAHNFYKMKFIPLPLSPLSPLF